MMKTFEYGDEEIGYKEFLFVIPSWLIAVGLLTITSGVVRATRSIDGWISLSTAGLLATLFLAITVQLEKRFPKQHFFVYAGKIVSKPVAWILTMGFAIYFFLWGAFEMRALANSSKQYLFDETPTEVICLLFWLVVIYAVSGSRSATLRLHLLFFPFVIVVVLIIIMMNMKYFEWGNLEPFFVSDLSTLMMGVKESILSFVGAEFILFYFPLLLEFMK